MATITTSAYNDSASRTAGETITISSGATFTIRTDSRLHATAPGSMTGSMGSVSFTDIGGTYYIDATKVRWLAYNSGTGNVPSIGTTITQGSVSGYFLGVWGSLGSAPTPSGNAMPSSGFIKFREVTGGNFSAGALSGIGASATGSDEVGWIEVVYDAGTNFAIPRVGTWITRGDWFKLGETNGNVGQEFQVPTTSSSQTNNFLPGVWVETSSGSNEYEFYPGLNGASNGWAYRHIGQPRGSVDKRCKFVRTEGNGKAIFGQNVDVNATYANATAQSSTYANATLSGTYIYENNKMIINTGSTAHLLEDGMSVGLEITSGGGTTGIYIITVLDAYNFEVTLTGSGTGGNVTVRTGLTITFNSHGLLEGEQVYCDFTSGTGVDGIYTVWRRTSANDYVISYPATAALTTGNVTCYHTVTVSATSHGLAVGNTVKLNVTSGGGTTGIYTIKTVATDSFTINMTHSAAISGNAVIEFTLGYVPPSGCKVRIPNIIIAECATGSRATNSVPNSTIASRPEITTTAAGALDLEYLYALSLYTGIINQAFSCKLYHCAFQDAVNISEIAMPLDIDNVGVGMYSAKDLRTINFTSCFAGGTVKNVVAMRGNAPNTTDHAFEFVYCNGITVNNLYCGIIQYPRSTGMACQITTCQNIAIDGVRVFNGNVSVATSINITIKNLDYNDRFIGRTNATSGYYAVLIGAGCNQIMVDGVTFGLGNTIEDCHPYSGIISITGSTNCTLRNCGTPSNPCNTGTWGVNTYGTAYAVYPAGNNNNIRFQKIYVTRLRTGIAYTLNSNKNILYDRVFAKYSWINSGTGTPRTLFTMNIADLNATIQGITTGGYPATAQTSVYGTHWFNMFLGPNSGAIILAMNEDTIETADYVIINAGNAKFNSAGGIEMRTVNDQVTWEMPYYFKGHTAFANITPVMSGGTIGNYLIQFKIDINDGNGYTSNWETLTAANLRNYDISNGFKLQLRITTTTNNSSKITYLRINTETSKNAQDNIDYPLDVSTVSFVGLQPGSEVRAYLGTDPTTAVEVAGIESTSGSTYSFTHSISGSGYIRIFSLGYQPIELPITYSGNDESFLIQQIIDRVYFNP